jgi:hypothetical protein
MKKIVRLTEGDLHRIINKSVNRLLREMQDDEGDKAALDDYMLNIRSTRDELGLSMCGYTNIGGETIIKLKRSSNDKQSIGFSLRNGQLYLHLIEDSTNKDITEPIKVPDYEDSVYMYQLLDHALNALFSYNGGFHPDDSSKEKQWDNRDNMYLDGVGLSQDDAIPFSRSNGYDANVSYPYGNPNLEDRKGREAMNAMIPDENNYNRKTARLTYPQRHKMRQADYKNKLYKRHNG